MGCEGYKYYAHFIVGWYCKKKTEEEEEKEILNFETCKTGLKINDDHLDLYSKKL